MWGSWELQSGFAGVDGDFSYDTPGFDRRFIQLLNGR